MYKMAVRKLISRNIRLANEGRYAPTLAMFAPDATLTFPGDNSWSRQHRVPRAGLDPHPTHRGRAEIEAFLRRYVEFGIQMEIEDILVNGPPWNMRAAVRVRNWILDGAGTEIYANRAVLMVRSRWGKLVDQEDYEDTQRVAAFDGRISRWRRSIVTPVDYSGAYLASVDRIASMATDANAAMPVRSCPPWTVHDLAAHMTGLAEDWVDDNLEGYASAVWTQAQIDRHRHRSIGELVGRWRERADQLVELPPHPVMGTQARWAFGDTLIHEADLRESCDDAGEPPADLVATHLGLSIERWEPQLRESGLAVTVITTDGHCYPPSTDADGATVSVRAGTYELWRALTGRRTQDAVLAMDWSGDAEAVVAAGLPYPFTVPEHPHAS